MPLGVVALDDSTSSLGRSTNGEMIVCSPKAVSPQKSTVEEKDGRDDVDLMLIGWVSYFGIWKIISAKGVLKELSSSAYMRPTCGWQRSHAQSSCDAISGICGRSVSHYVSSDSTPERDHGRLFLSSLPSPVHRMPLYSEDGKSSGSAFSEDGRGGTEPVSTVVR